MGVYSQGEASTILDERFAELALKYSPEVVVEAWNEVITTGGPEANAWIQCKKRNHAR